MNPAEQRFGFLFPADTGRWLFILRVGLGLEILFYTLSLRSDWNLIFGGSGHGLLGRDVADAMAVVQSPLIPRLGWFIFLFQQIGLDESLALSAIWWCLLTLGCFLILGLFSRPAAILTWFLQLACAKSGGLLSYGADNLITIGLFYLMIAPLPDPWSLDSLLRYQSEEESAVARLPSSRIAGASLPDLLFWRPDQMSGRRLVEWLQFVALIDDSPIQYPSAPLGRVLGISAACHWDRYLPAGDDVSVSHLVGTHAKAGPLCYLRAASRRRSLYGHVPFRRYHACLEPRRILAARTSARNRTGISKPGSGPEFDLIHIAEKIAAGRI